MIEYKLRLFLGGKVLKSIFKKLVLIGFIFLIVIQCNLGLSTLNFAQVVNNNDYEPSSDKFTVTINSDGKYIDSGYRVSDTVGKVLIRRGDQPTAWENAWSGDTLYEGDVIFVGKDTECTVTLPNQLTIRMQSQTELFFDFNEQKHQLKVIYGKVLANFEADYDQPNLEFILSQANVSVDHAIVIFESKETTSRVLVLAGNAEVTDPNKSKVSLKHSEEVVVQESGSESIQSFSVDSELLEWTSEIRNKVDADLKNRYSKSTEDQIQENTTIAAEENKNSNYDMISIFKLFAVLIVAVGTVYIILGKRNK